MTTLNNEKLKQEISSRWRLILTDGMESKAFYQLEYILMEAGLLAKPRKRKPKAVEIARAIRARDEYEDKLAEEKP